MNFLLFLACSGVMLSHSWFLRIRKRSCSDKAGHEYSNCSGLGYEMMIILIVSLACSGAMLSLNSWFLRLGRDYGAIWSFSFEYMEDID